MSFSFELLMIRFLIILIGFIVGSEYSISEIASGALLNDTEALSGGQTLAFMVLALCQVVQAFNMRSDKSLFKIGPFSNHKLNWATLISILLVCLVLFTPLSVAFGLITLPAHLYLKGLVLAFIPVLIMEIAKAFGLVRHQH